MNKALALLIVASLLLAGCTELAESDDGETLNIEIDEEIALEKINDFVTVDTTESFGITVMYEIDSSSMDDGMMDLDEDTVMIVEMTEAWSPEGYHSSEVMGMDDGDVIISMASSMTHIGTTIYVSMEYEIDGELGDDATEDEIAEFNMMVAMMPEAEVLSMVSATTHTEVIAAMAEETADNSDDMDPMAMLEMIEMIEQCGQFTLTDPVDGLQMFDATLDTSCLMAGEIPTPDEALEMCDIDGNGGISWTEFTSEECDGPDDDGSDGSDDDAAIELLFNDADTDSSGELTVDELQPFIDDVTAFYGDDMDDEMEMMPAMKVAFTSTGDIEYFSMEMEGTEMMMYVLSESKVDELFTDVDAGELVALPFSISGDSGPGTGDGTFYCDDGTAIPMSYVNDGWEDCDGGEDEMDDYYDTIYYDGCTESTDPADSYYECWMDDWLNSDGDIMMSDGYDMDECWEDAGLGGWECEPSDGDWMEITFICGSDGTEIPFDYVNDGDDDCSDGSDEQIYDSDGYEVNWFDCMDGSTIWISQVNDGTEDCPDGEDETYDMEDLIEETFGMMDSDDDGIVTWDEVDAFVVNEEGGWDSDAERDADMAMFNDYDADSSGGLDADEFAELIMSEVSDDDHGDEEMVCYDMSSHAVDESIDNEADCDAAGLMWTAADSGPGGEDGGEIVMYITSEMDFYFEGDMSDYKIELAECDYDYDSDTGEEIETCTTVMSVAVTDAGADSDIMFHDADSSGTISNGDMIHIGETSEDWNKVRLYSISADAYSDENPMHDMPGFTGLVGMLALLGAAFIRRNE